MRSPLLALILLLVGCPKGEESLRKANVLFKNGELDQAGEMYRAAAEADPERVAARAGLGNVAFEQKRYDAAIGHYRKAIELDREALDVRHSLAVVLTESGRSADAVKLLEETVQIAPQDAFSHHALGGLYKKSGDLERAKAQQLEALRIDESLHAARYALGNVLLDLGETAEAEREYSRLFAAGQKKLAAYGYARLAATQKKWDEVARQLTTVLDGGASRPEQVLDDPVFKEGWSEAPMRAIRERLKR